MSYVLVSTEDFHRGPTRLSSVDPYLHEKLPLTIIKDTIFYQGESQYDPHGRYWKFRVEDAPVRVLNKLMDIGYRVKTGSCLSSGRNYDNHSGHAWTLYKRDVKELGNSF
ncbi:unnamed protein product [Medioppia subpectinata]|uniref:Uncharacterized protein n=1 Tax=Medioppia subpectinata TaxID=1979941 RepID=A0A7R9L8F4_9ACAR|nr:unnamed protein product [Medioppia subpectinata]CAG2116864.1 unnamed protein product [Medioppia subpectinata]